MLRLVLAAAGCTLVLAGCDPTEQQAAPTEPVETAATEPTLGEAGRTVSLPLDALDDSGVTGEAIFTSSGDETRVLVMLDEPVDEPRAVHVHPGRCARLAEEEEAPIAYDLGRIEDDLATFALDVPLDVVLESPHVVAVHAPDDGVHLACGDLPGP